MEYKILITEDEIDTAEFVKEGLKAEGFKPQTVTNARDTMLKLKQEKFDLLILDLALPDQDGIEVCKTIRQDPFLRNLPIIMLTARDEPEDRIVGLEAGADDYVTKPFQMRELVLRIKGLLKRTRIFAELPDEVISKSGITINVAQHKVTIDMPIEVDLAPKEFELLYLLMKNCGKVLTREYLLDALWGYPAGTKTRTLDVHVQRLRKKLRDEKGRIIQTVEGYGYKFVEV